MTAPTNKETTPEWERAFLGLFIYNERLCCNGDYCQAKCAEHRGSEILDFIRSLLTTATAEAREKGRKEIEDMWEAHTDTLPDVLAPCVSCGKPGKYTIKQLYKLNALGGRCVECVEKTTNTGTSARHSKGE